MLADAKPDDQKQMLGERLFPLIQVNILTSTNKFLYRPQLLTGIVLFCSACILTWLERSPECCWKLTTPIFCACWNTIRPWRLRFVVMSVFSLLDIWDMAITVVVFFFQVEEAVAVLQAHQAKQTVKKE